MKLNQMMKQAKALQDKLKQQIGEIRVEATAGGGMVTVVANGKGEILSVRIDPEVARGEDQEMLQDLVTAAANDALRKARELLAQEVSRVAGGLGLPGLL